jgi:hypothetical protein
MRPLAEPIRANRDAANASGPGSDIATIREVTVRTRSESARNARAVASLDYEVLQRGLDHNSDHAGAPTA